MNTFVMIPTFNESENIGNLIDSILNHVRDAKILVVDDNSPDKTAEVVHLKIKEYPRRVFLLLRKIKKGRGSAGIDGFKFALKKHADVVVEMDADLSHDPKYLPKMLSEIPKHDVVLGSRFVGSGRDERGVLRHMITRVGNFYIRHMLGLKIRDCTSGYRAFKAQVLRKINLEKLISSGPSIVQEILYKADILGFDIKEVPIVFTDRRVGRSKFNFKIMLQGILMVLTLKFILSDVWREEV